MEHWDQSTYVDIYKGIFWNETKIIVIIGTNNFLAEVRFIKALVYWLKIHQCRLSGKLGTVRGGKSG